mgnify:CR=1 FL=1
MSIERQLIRTGVTVFYRSIFDAVRDLLHDEAFDGHEKAMARSCVSEKSFDIEKISRELKKAPRR